MLKFCLAALASLLPLALAATPFDGLYRPAGMDWWDCRSVGMDGGALQISGDRLYGVESACRLENPVTVRGLGGVLYDMTCSGEGETSQERLMLMPGGAGLYLVRPGFVGEWEACR